MSYVVYDQMQRLDAGHEIIAVCDRLEAARTYRSACGNGTRIHKNGRLIELRKDPETQRGESWSEGIHEKIEWYITAAHAELGPECEDAYVRELEAYLRAYRADWREGCYPRE